MPSYKYSAIGSDGRSVSGRLDAANKTECVAELRRRSLTPVDIQEKGGERPAPLVPRTLQDLLAPAARDLAPA